MQDRVSCIQRTGQKSVAEEPVTIGVNHQNECGVRRKSAGAREELGIGIWIVWRGSARVGYDFVKWRIIFGYCLLAGFFIELK
jgi:hypothetical protein